ncbi:MAG: hypothetical protein K8L99_11355, partial [Anaerolineae bacterium]|nr:hypothetical protein [Anaerolineae bacterium]
MNGQENLKLQEQDAVYAMAGSQGVYFAARGTGLYCSRDDGQNWNPAYDNTILDKRLTTTAIAVHGQNIFAGVKGGILRSSNGGENWFTAVLPPPAPLVSALAVSPNFEEDGVLVASTVEDGVFVSTDRGMSWLPWNFGLLDLNVYAVAFSPNFEVDQVVCIGTESGIFQSKTGGRAWRPIPFSMDAAPVLSLGFSPDFVHSGRIYAGTETHGLYTSDDGGMTWKLMGENDVTGAVNAITTVATAPLE